MTVMHWQRPSYFSDEQMDRPKLQALSLIAIYLTITITRKLTVRLVQRDTPETRYNVAS